MPGNEVRGSEMRGAGSRGGATLDLRAAQSPAYRERGVGRYALGLTRALVAGHPGLVSRIRVDADLAPVDGLGDLGGSGLLSTATVSRDGTDRGGTYHLMAPFDLDVPLTDLWPRAVSARRMHLVVTIYDLIPEIMADVYLSDPGRRRRYRARRELVRAADAVVTLSASSAADVVHLLGLPPARVHVVGAACADAFAPPVSRRAAAAAARTAIAGLGLRWIAYNGAVEARKNMERLIEAYARLPPALRDGWQLVLVCALDPLQRNHYEIRARQLGIEGRLVLTGFLPDDRLALLYQGADLVAFPSLYEGYGLPVSEALACGARVVASATSALSELVAPGATFDPLDTAGISAALARALSDDGLRRRLDAWAARPQSTWADVADRVAAVHHQLMARQPPGERLGDGQLQPSHLQNDQPPGERLGDAPLQPSHLQDDQPPGERLPEQRLPDDRLPGQQPPDDRVPDRRPSDDQLPDQRLRDRQRPAHPPARPPRRSAGRPGPGRRRLGPATPLAPDFRPPGAGWPRHPRVAMVTPWPPQRTGVADYSAHLVAALAGRADVDLFVDGDFPGDRGLPGTSLGMAPPTLPRVAPVRGGYDAVVLTLGNSEFHSGALRLLRTGGLRPLVLAHDVRLTGLYRHSEARGAVPEGFGGALAAMYPDLGDPALGEVADGCVPADVAERHGLLMAREAIARSGCFLTTSDDAAALARLDAAPGDAGRVGVWPFAYPEVVRRAAADEDEGLVASFGLVDPAKQPDLLVKAMAELAPGRPSARMVFVGPAGAEEQRRLRRLAGELGVDDRVAFTGYTSADAYEEWLRRASVAVQLRRTSNGETSAAVADCLTHAVATVVTDMGPQRGLPSSVAKVARDADGATLAATVGRLLDHRAARHRMGLEAQAWVASRGFPQAADHLVALIAGLDAGAGRR